MPIKNSVIDAYSEILNHAYNTMIKDQKKGRATIFESENAGAIDEIRPLYNLIVTNINVTRENVEEYESRVKSMVKSIPEAKMPKTIAGYCFDSYTADHIASPDALSKAINPFYDENANRVNFSRQLSTARNNRELDAVTLSIVENNDLWDYLSDTDLVALHLDDEKSE